MTPEESQNALRTANIAAATKNFTDALRDQGVTSFVVGFALNDNPEGGGLTKLEGSATMVLNLIASLVKLLSPADFKNLLAVMIAGDFFEGQRQAVGMGRKPDAAPANPDMQHFYCYDDHAERQAMFDAGIIFRVPSIHMPRWASRITLEITDVRVQRLWDISEEDAVAEGIHPYEGPPPAKHCGDPRHNYANLWDSINGKKHPWADNPWIWALTFKRLP